VHRADAATVQPEPDDGDSVGEQNEQEQRCGPALASRARRSSRRGRRRQRVNSFPGVDRAVDAAYSSAGTLPGPNLFLRGLFIGAASACAAPLFVAEEELVDLVDLVGRSRRISTRRGVRSSRQPSPG
jgi:hypothetical protein